MYVSFSGNGPDEVVPIFHASASHRRYYRLRGKGGTVIGTEYDNVRENAAFLYLSRHFREKGLPVPEILAESADHMAYLQEDLGGDSLYGRLEAAGFSFTEKIKALYGQVVEQLAALQIRGHEGLDYTRCLSQHGFGKEEMLWDLSYFKYYFLKILDAPFDEYALEREFQALAGWLGEAQPRYFMHRDFQSRNILLSGDQPFFIDYQGGRLGPLQYDLVSLLWQAKANIPHPVRLDLLNRYLDAATAHIALDRGAFIAHYYGFVLLRSLQVLGAYGLRGLVEKKSHFLQSIPFALGNIRWVLENGDLPYELTELKTALDHAGQKFLPGVAVNAASGNSLHVLVQSFSYKKGIPADESGHGGGYVFDCRGIENPGRQEAYRTLSGRSPEVIAFLQQHSNMDSWLEHVFATVSETVGDYLSRGRERLSISFGCTGGQHRSVYAAERTAAFLREEFGVKVELLHTQKDDWPLG